MPPEDPESRAAGKVRLAELQRRIWHLVTAPEGVQSGTSALAELDPGALPLSGWVAAKDEAGAIARLDVYANMYFWRLLDALKADLPVVELLLGDPGFHNLVTDYLIAYPSTDPSLRHAGQYLPRFLEEHPVPDRRSDLADLVRLELARLDAFDAAVTIPSGRADLAAVPADAWATLHFAIVPSTKLLRPAETAVRTWAAVDAGTPPPAPQTHRTGVIIWRDGWKVWHRTVSLAEIDALESLHAGGSFADACEILAQDAAAPDQAPSDILDRLCHWLDDGLLMKR